MTREEKMTPEEAIAEISFLKVAVNKVMEQALDMAISAILENEELSKDLDEALKEIDMYERGLSQEPTDENLHREREQAYMQGYEDASKRFRQEPCDDVVSREAVLKLKHHKPEYGDMIYAFDVEQLPSVTQKSKTGHWIKKEDDTCWWYACSECEQEPLKNRWNDDDVLSAFCPNCGSAMKGE